MRGYPQFSFWISIAPDMIYLSHTVITWEKYFPLVGTVLKPVDCIECQKKKQAESRTYGFELRSKLFLSVCKSPTLSLTFHQTYFTLFLWKLNSFMWIYAKRKKTSRKRCVYNHGDTYLFRSTCTYTLHLFQLRLLQRRMMHDPFFIARGALL